MAKVAVALKINMAKIDQQRLFQGQQGQYLDATIFIDMDQLDQYGNSGMITQDVSKEEKQQGTKGNILGNGKVFWTEGLAMPQPQAQHNQQQQYQPQQQQGGFNQHQQQQGGFNQQPQQQPQKFGNPSGQPAPQPNQQPQAMYDQNGNLIPF